MSKPRHELMDEFATKMNELYEMAGSLRDMASGDDKGIFNDTRRALYHLRDQARDQYYEWKELATKTTVLLIAVMLFSCSPSLRQFKPVSTEAYQKEIIVRNGGTNISNCSKGIVGIATNEKDFIYTTQTQKIVLRDIKSVSDERALFTATEAATKNPCTLYLYFADGYMNLKGDWLVQISPVVRGTLKQENEVMRIISNRNICN